MSRKNRRFTLAAAVLAIVAVAAAPLATRARGTALTLPSEPMQH